MNQMRLTAVVAAVVGLTLTASAKIELGTPFADGMVLQRGMMVPVWGRVSPAPGKSQRTVEVSFAGQVKSAEVDAQSATWKVEFDPLETSKEGHSLTVRELVPGLIFDSECDKVVLDDVLVGEVWFVSGQSNAEMPLWGDSPRFLGHINGNRIELSTEGIASPKGVRYLYSRPWYGSIYNEVCLPLGSFSVDLAAEPALKPRVPAGASSSIKSSGRRF